MKPYYDHAGITIYHGDCREILPSLPKVDLVLTDPPYAVDFSYEGGVDSDMRVQTQVISSFLGRADVLLTPGIANVCGYPQPRWVICWLKKSSMGASRLSGPQAVSRNLWEPVFYYGHYPKNPPSRDIIEAPIQHRDLGSSHPCPKPIALFLRLVGIGSVSTDLILDPFMGSGTTLVAAKQLGRKAIGIEIEEKYCEIAAKRLSQEVLPLEPHDWQEDNRESGNLFSGSPSGGKTHE